MYESHFQLNQAPFSIAPDPEFLFLSDEHREALAHLSYGLTQGGFVLITGEVGTGKTTLLRSLLRQIPSDVDVAFILNPRLTVRELLESICDELGIEYPQSDRTSVKQYVDALNAHLLKTHAENRSTLLIIDEAQNLTPAVLEQIRLLTNLETDKRKLLRIILLGQPELLELLARRELRQLAQRITARYHLGGLDREATSAYVIHRLQRAGGSALIFTRPALNRLHRISRGTPRLINLVADRALLGAYAAGRHRVHWRMIGRAAREVMGTARWRASRVGGAIAIGVLAAAVGAYLLLAGGESTPLLTERAEPSVASEHAPPAAARDAAGGDPAAAIPPASDVATKPDATASTTLAPPADPAVQEPIPTAGADAIAADAPDDAVDNARARATPANDAPVEEVRADRVGADGIAADESSTATNVRAPNRAGPARPDMSTGRSQRLAYQAAFARWGADFSSASLDLIPCDFAPSADLQCLGGSGTWNDLRRMNLPAVLELWDENSAPFYGALLALSADQMTLNIGGTDYRFTPAHLADNWFGGYVLLWKTPPGYTGTARPGDRHPTVAWLRERLAAVGFETPATPEPDVFDPTLRDALIRFQEQESMQADGIAGPMTWIHIAQRAGMEQPSLEN